MKIQRIHPELDWINLTPEAGHYLFGYYDRCPWDNLNRLHLAIRVPQQDRIPAVGEKADVGIVERETRKFNRLAQTEAWNHQQGAMTLWLRHRPGCFVYNDFDMNSGQFVARIYDIAKGAAGEYDTPIYAISKDGKWGVTLNFARIPRRGYSYARAFLPKDYKDGLDLKNDGLFLINMRTGEKRLIASYEQIMEIIPYPYDLANKYCWINHAVFNCDSSRVMVLFRYATDTSGWPYRTFMYTMNIDGSELICSLPDIYWRNGAITHQMWGRTPREILVDADWCDKGHQFIVFEENVQPIIGKKISDGFGPLSHLLFSPDSRWIVADTRVWNDGYVRLGLVDVTSGQLKEIGRFHYWRENVITDDMTRCDLHPRLSDDGSLITVDTIHSGERKIFMIQTKEAVERLFA